MINVVGNIFALAWIIIIFVVLNKSLDHAIHMISKYLHKYHGAEKKGIFT